MENVTYNRVERDLLSMLDQEKKDRMLYPNYTAKERYILEDKLKHMISVNKKYQSSPTTADERRTIKKLRGKIKDVEKQLYPTITKKIMGRIKRRVEDVREKYRYVPRPEMGTSIQQQESLSNVQRLKNATKEKLKNTIEKVLPNFIKPHKQAEEQTNIYSVKQGIGNQTNRAVSSIKKTVSARARHRHRLQ